jgi:signal transduction histidine kinase
VRGYGEALAEGRVAPEDLPRVGAVLGTETDRLRRLIEDLMLLSRIEAAEFGLRPEPLDLAAHLRGVLEGFRERAALAGVRLVDATEAVGTVTVDADRIAQVVANLLENALRYTPEAGTVTLTLRSGAPGVEIVVADTGPGIDPADLPHVFERLYVATRYRPVRPEGSGLGLSIVANLVAAMGGRAVAESPPGGGTTIRVRLPGHATAHP